MRKLKNAPTNGEMIQLDAMAPILCHWMAAGPIATTPNPMTAPIMAWVVDTGWLR